MIFVDSGAWIALVNRRDQRHDDAVETFNNLVQAENTTFNHRLRNC